MLTLDLGKQADRFIQKLPQKHAAQIMRKLLELQTNPYPPDHKLLRGFSYLYSRVDSGEYRIVYMVKSPLIIVRIVGKRNDNEVYKRLKRMDG
ncbi:hypothetical protein A3A39_02935 [Candidatus Kaiserbacteria bacterium RIFCSPLOWO2_01_FULL_54_13]|uniref:Addiction module toxin RelE n=1 Tax=Candidatus Kaiserbacteria bacterium RIFCSPLOWO2_01_FULL_54_13 TaxID=1798512 RepID=A0A1F6F2V6_9BACT|nr:MAG: hypothetical protein A3A39_02935 [Candidatus Kaiserbacteria bacterium RIFCSPLOWO2_01_FULL_54_13]